MKLQIHHFNHPDKETVEHFCWIERALGTINRNLENLMSKLDDLKADLADYFAKAQSDHDDLKAQVEALKSQASDVSDADLQSVMDSIDAAKAKIAPVAAAVAPAADPAAPAAQ